MLDLWRDRGIDSPLDQSSALQAAKRGSQQSMRHALDEPRHRLEAHGPLRTPRQPPSPSICPCPILDVQHNATPGVRAPQFVAAIDAAVKAGVGHVVLVSSTATREVAEPDIYAPSARVSRPLGSWRIATVRSHIFDSRDGTEATCRSVLILVSKRRGYPEPSSGCLMQHGLGRDSIKFRSPSLRGNFSDPFFFPEPSLVGYRCRPRRA